MLREQGQAGLRHPLNKSDFGELKSHSSFLTNERIAIMFYRLDGASIEMNRSYSTVDIDEVRGILMQVWKNIRSLARGSPGMRNLQQLDTSVDGVYTIDVELATVDKMMWACRLGQGLFGKFGFTYQTNYILSQRLNQLELVIRDCLQHFGYFFRPDYKVKPDVMLAVEEYKRRADSMTIEQLRQHVGKNPRIDFEALARMPALLAQAESSEHEEEDEQYYDDFISDKKGEPEAR